MRRRNRPLIFLVSLLRLTLTLVVAAQPVLATAVAAVPCGDVNGDGVVNIGDALVVAQFDVGLRQCGVAPFIHPEVCDVNGDGACNIGDALRMAQCDVGLISFAFTCGPFTCPSTTSSTTTTSQAPTTTTTSTSTTTTEAPTTTTSLTTTTTPPTTTTSSTTTTQSTTTSTTSTTTTTTLPGTCTGACPIHTVFLILMENHDWSSIKGSPSAPYINDTLLPIASHAEQYYNPPGVHPSEPNYLWLEAGTNFGIRNDKPPARNHQRTASHLVNLLEAAGLSWPAHHEDINRIHRPPPRGGFDYLDHAPFPLL